LLVSQPNFKLQRTFNRKVQMTTNVAND